MNPLTNILVINSGSSSLKFQLFQNTELNVKASGFVERIGEKESRAELDYIDDSGRRQCLEKKGPVDDHRQAVHIMTELLAAAGVLSDISDLTAIGHRVVHGGELFHEPVLINEKILAAIEDLGPLAPLHNPANVTGIRVVMERAPEIPQVAVFDTAFHQSIPEHAYLYALPYSLYEQQKVRRYGFHGTSHGYVSRKAADFLGRPPEELNIISMHLGNGASAAAIRGGQCVDTSMGMTPLEGLIMGTRSGDLDPAILFYLARETGMDLDRIDEMLNRESGLKGICGEKDMRTITGKAKKGNSKAILALTMFCYRLKKYIGSYCAILGGVDCLIFTGGIGENSALVREMSCQGLEGLGIYINDDKNRSGAKGIFCIESKESAVRILVVPTDEEREIAERTLGLIHPASAA